jgi:hypothetical protein
LNLSDIQDVVVKSVVSKLIRESNMLLKSSVQEYRGDVQSTTYNDLVCWSSVEVKAWPVQEHSAQAPSCGIGQPQQYHRWRLHWRLFLCNGRSSGDPDAVLGRVEAFLAAPVPLLKPKLNSLHISFSVRDAPGLLLFTTAWNIIIALLMELTRVA